MEPSVKSPGQPSRVALLGFGTVGQSVARILCRGDAADVRLTHIFNRNIARKRAETGEVREPAKVIQLPMLA